MNRNNFIYDKRFKDLKSVSIIPYLINECKELEMVETELFYEILEDENFFNYVKETYGTFEHDSLFYKIKSHIPIVLEHFKNEY